MRRLDDRRLAEERPEVRGIPPPQDRDERGVACDERADGVLGDLLPAPAPVGCRCPGRDREHPVQQHDALVAPRRQVAVRGARDAEIGLELLIDVREAPRQRSHVRVDGEREPDRMPGCRVGVLADDEHLDVVEGPLERAEDAVAGGKVVAACRDLGPQPLAERGDVGADRIERAAPSRGRSVPRPRARAASSPPRAAQSAVRGRSGPRASRCCADCATGRIVMRSRLTCPGAPSA